MSLELALCVVEKLFEAGFIAYFAGGWVRDYLLGNPSQEIDIATNATPEHICRLFPKTVLVGAQFGVVIVVVKGVNFEVTTFRKDNDYHDGRRPASVDFSSPEKDAERRDFTINGMFYDPLTDKIYDFVNGKADLHKKIIRAIGNPEKRFEEDKLRLIRAIRFAYRFGFTIEEKTGQALKNLSTTLFPSVSMERVWQELTKMSRAPRFKEALLAMHEYGLLPTIFPKLADVSQEEMVHRLSSLDYFPLNTPTIVYIWELFCDLNLEERIAICHYLKITKQDIKLAQFFSHASELFKKDQASAAEWVEFYAHPSSALFLEIQSAKIQDRRAFFSLHDSRKNRLNFHIQWIAKKQPLVKAFHLQKEGIRPGIKMGLLLDEAKKIAINEDVRVPEEIIKRLKKTPLW